MTIEDSTRGLITARIANDFRGSSRSTVAFVLPAATAADWPTVHARPLEAWRPALVHISEQLGLPEAWTRLPGGEDSAVFAVGEHRQ